MLDVLMEPRHRLPHFLNSDAIPVGPIESIAAIKVDVEGHEAAVLRGGLRLIRKYRPVLICEFWDAEAKQSIADLLAQQGYVTSGIESERNLLGIPEERHADWRAGYGSWRETNAAGLDVEAGTVLTFAP
jgi:hypothetical protein